MEKLPNMPELSVFSPAMTSHITTKCLHTVGELANSKALNLSLKWFLKFLTNNMNSLVLHPATDFCCPYCKEKTQVKQ